MRLSHKRQHVVVLVALGLVWLVFCWRFWTPSPEDRLIFVQDGDFSLHYFAPIQQQMARFAQGELAQWNPYNRAGFPHIGNVQNSTFYPPRYVVWALTGGGEWPIETLQWESLAHVWLTSVLMYAFLLHVFPQHRRRVEIAALGALVWAYSGYITGYPILHINILETVTWLPLALLGVRLMPTRRWMGGSALTGIAVALMALAGHPQVALYLVYLIAAYALFNGRAEGMTWRQTTLRLVLAFALGGGLAAVQILPGFELMRLSSRVVVQNFEEKGLGLSLSSAADMLWANGAALWSPLYVGPVVLLLAAGAAFARQRAAAFWLIVLVVGLFFTFGGSTVVYSAFYVFAPGISTFRHQERAVAVVVFAMTMLAVYGTAWLTGDPDSDRLRRYGMIVYIAAGVLGAIYIAAQTVQRFGVDIPPGQIQVFGMSALMAALFAAWIAALRFGSAMLAAALICVDLVSVALLSPNYAADTPQNRLQLDAPLQSYDIEATDFAWRVDGGAGLQGAGDYFHVPDIYGVGPFSLASVDGLYTLPVDRFWEIFSVRYATISDPPPASVALDLLAEGVNRDGQPYRLVELQDPRPLAQLVYDYRQAEGSAEFARQIMADPNIVLREQGVTLRPLPFELPVTRPAVSRIDDTAWQSPERLTMRVSTGADALLTLSVVNYPGWKAIVNGQPAEIVDVYAGLIGIPLREGENQTVELYFKSESLALGAAISLAAMIATAALLVVNSAVLWNILARSRRT